MGSKSLPGLKNVSSGAQVPRRGVPGPLMAPSTPGPLITPSPQFTDGTISQPFLALFRKYLLLSVMLLYPVLVGDMG